MNDTAGTAAEQPENGAPRHEAEPAPPTGAGFPPGPDAGSPPPPPGGFTPSAGPSGPGGFPPPGPPPPGWQGSPTPGTPQPPLAPNEERLWALLSHLSYFVLGIIGPVVIMLTLGQRSKFVRDQAVEALNFHITAAIAITVSILLIVVFVGILLLPVVAIAGAVFSVIAAIQANQGVNYRYPVTIRFVR